LRIDLYSNSKRSLPHIWIADNNRADANNKRMIRMRIPKCNNHIMHIRILLISTSILSPYSSPSLLSFPPPHALSGLLLISRSLELWANKGNCSPYKREGGLPHVEQPPPLARCQIAKNELFKNYVFKKLWFENTKKLFFQIADSVLLFWKREILNANLQF
jgi:hypothetical protein